MNDIADPIMKVERACRKITEQIAHGTMTPTQVRLTHEFIMDALTNILEARKWTVDYLAKHSAQHGPTAQHNETRSVDEEGYSLDWSQVRQQSGQDIDVLQNSVIDLQSRVEKIEGQLLQSQMQTQPCVGAKQGSQREIEDALRRIHERAEAENKRTTVVEIPQFHFVCRSSKVD